MSHKVLVPIDFSEVTENALKFAIGAARIFNTGIALLHIVNNESEKPAAEDRLNEVIYKYDYAGVPMKSYTKGGNIFDGIGEAANELECGLIIMGTHGLKGMQFLFGSHALKVVTHSEVPFIITQNRAPKNDDINSIVVPIDLGSDEKQVLTAVIKAAQSFKASVHLFVSKHSDEFQENAVNRNLSFAKRYLAEHGITYSSTRAGTTSDFDKQLIKFADSISADMIAIINHKEDGIKNLFGASFDQNVITNSAEIPVLIINSKDMTKIGSIFQVFA